MTLIGLNCTGPTDPAMESINIQRVVVHPDYRPTTKINDIAILILPSPAVVRPVEMATKQEIDAALEATLVGFGNNNLSASSGFGLKREVSVPTDRHTDINEAEARLGFESDVEFTAGGKGKDTCTGDSGGPAYLIGGDGNFKVAGLTSRPYRTFGTPCGEGGVYTRVDVHLDFIRKVAGQSGITV